MSRRGVLLIALTVVAGCRAERGRGPESAAAPSSFSATRIVSQRATHGVQVGSFSTATAALAIRDSMAVAGWRAFVVAARVQDTTRWRVLVAPTNDTALAELIATALRRENRQAIVARVAPSDTTTTIGVRLVHATHGTYGMSSTVRWVQPADRHALLVTVDPTAVEAEPVPNGFVFADERGDKWLQVDRVWDVAPSPDWTMLAYGKAYVVHDREGEVPPQRWTQLAQQIGPTVAGQLFPDENGASRIARLARELQTHKFASSGMAIAYGVGITFVERTEAIPSSDSGATRVAESGVLGDAVVLEGWRTRWTRAGDTLGVGASPKGAQDYSPASRWILVPPRAGGGQTVFGSVADSARLEPVGWTNGATLDISVPVDLTAPDSLLGGTVRSVGGWIRVLAPGRTARIIGPGRVLAATANGRYIAALAPRPGAASYETPAIVVVYEVR